jgi:hypothetical protein
LVLVDLSEQLKLALEDQRKLRAAIGSRQSSSGMLKTIMPE